MIAALIITFVYIFVVWLVFFRLRVARFNVVWGIVTFWVGIHVLLVFLVGMRFSQPYTRDLRVVRHTVQLVPRLPEPALLEEVLVVPNAPVKKGNPLFRFDARPYRYKVDQLEAELAAARQNVRVLKAQMQAADDDVKVAEADRLLAREQVDRYTAMSREGAARETTLDEWRDKLSVAVAKVQQANAELREATLKYESTYEGVHTQVATIEAELAQARYNLEQTTLYAPEDGFIVNLQAEPGLVVGRWRVGAIASLVVDRDPYLLGTYHQQHLKFVEPGQPVEVALDLYPGQIVTGRVETVWWATGQGQFMPRAQIPEFVHPQLKGRFAVKIRLTGADLRELPVGAQGAAAIYTDVGAGFAPLRRLVIRTYTWGNWLYPLPF